jgi:hypothetical protein
MQNEDKPTAQRVELSRQMRVLSLIGSGLSFADAMELLFPEEAKKMESLMVNRGPQFF